jgi:hypothetical protein
MDRGDRSCDPTEHPLRALRRRGVKPVIARRSTAQRSGLGRLGGSLSTPSSGIQYAFLTRSIAGTVAADARAATQARMDADRWIDRAAAWNLRQRVGRRLEEMRVATTRANASRCGSNGWVCADR